MNSVSFIVILYDNENQAMLKKKKNTDIGILDRV